MSQSCPSTAAVSETVVVVEATDAVAVATVL